HARSPSFFCQAEDGIRDRNVTGVQTCALPIFCGGCRNATTKQTHRGPRPNVPKETGTFSRKIGPAVFFVCRAVSGGRTTGVSCRSEERRVGGKGVSRWGRGHERRKTEQR